MKHRISVGIVAALVALVMAAPAFGAGQSQVGAAAQPKVIVFAAASLNHVFPAMVKPFKAAYPKYRNVRFVFNFNGTDVLQTQLQNGAPCDLFAGANTTIPAALFTGGFLNRPVNFCQNKLVVIVPKGNPAKLKSLVDLTNPGVEIAIGDATVPVGKYTRTVLTNLNAAYPQFTTPDTYSALVLKNVVSTEINVSAVVALVQINEVDAGFVYWSDYKYGFEHGTISRFRLTIPNHYQSNPLPTYPIAVAKKATRPGAAAAFMSFVLRNSQGQKLLVDYGFLPKPVPAITTIAPTSGLAGSSVTITGKNFGTVGSVRFGGTTATTTAWSPTSITATVPASLAPGASKVTVKSGQLVSKAVTFTVVAP